MSIVTTSPVGAYVDAFSDWPLGRRDGRARYADLRRHALDRLARRGFATAGREEWRYFETGAVTDRAFLPYGGEGDGQRAAAFLPAPRDTHRLVFVNGRYRDDLSTVENLPDGVTVAPLSAADEQSGLGRLADPDGSPFTALNAVFWSDGLALDLPAGASLDRPVELFFVVDEETDGRLTAPRNLITAGPGSRASIVEHFVGPAGIEHLTAPITEIDCGEGAEISHLKWLREGPGALHVGGTHVRQAADSRYRSWELALDGSVVRRELHLDLQDPGAACDLKGLALGAGEQRLDMRTRVRHSAPDCRTDELYKGLYEDSSRGVFDGLIEVAKDAQQTAAHQTNRNLLLSDESRVVSIPRLEIYADDVKCSHGSTTGQLDDEQLFFLRSRGFDEEAARALLAYAFVSEIVQDVQPAALRPILSAEIVHRLGDRSPIGGM